MLRAALERGGGSCPHLMVLSMSPTRYTACSMRRSSCFAQSAPAAAMVATLQRGLESWTFCLVRDHLCGRPAGGKHTGRVGWLWTGMCMCMPNGIGSQCTAERASYKLTAQVTLRRQLPPPLPPPPLPPAMQAPLAWIAVASLPACRPGSAGRCSEGLEPAGELGERLHAPTPRRLVELIAHKFTMLDRASEGALACTARPAACWDC